MHGSLETCRHLWLLASRMLSIVFHGINISFTYSHCISPFCVVFKASMGFPVFLHVLPLKKGKLLNMCLLYLHLLSNPYLYFLVLFNFQREAHIHIFIILIVVSLLFIPFVWKPFLHGTISSNP